MEQDDFFAAVAALGSIEELDVAPLSPEETERLRKVER